MPKDHHHCSADHEHKHHDHHHGHGHSQGHGHFHSHSHGLEGQKAIRFALILNLAFATIELVGGILTNSMAILADSLHDFGDSLALMLALVFEKIGAKSANPQYTYGHRRFTLLSALLNGLILIVGSIFVIKEAVMRLIAGGEEVHTPGMIGLALLGIVVNAVAALRLMKNGGMNQRVVALHMLEDLYGWLGVLAVSIVLLFKPWWFLDAAVSVIISLLILFGVYRNLKEIIQILMQKFPSTIDMDKILGEIKQLENVRDVHFVQGWTIDGAEHSLTFHVEIPDELKVVDMDKIKRKMKTLVRSHGVNHCTIEFEGQENCPENQNP